MNDIEKGWYVTPRGRRVEVLSVDDVRSGPTPDSAYFEVMAYRYEGRDYIHIRSTADCSWHREPEVTELTLEARVALLEQRLREVEGK